jgi:hypothetical protein
MHNSDDSPAEVQFTDWIAIRPCSGFHRSSIHSSGVSSEAASSRRRQHLAEVDVKSPAHDLLRIVRTIPYYDEGLASIQASDGALADLLNHHLRIISRWNNRTLDPQKLIE